MIRDIYCYWVCYNLILTPSVLVCLQASKAPTRPPDPTIDIDYYYIFDRTWPFSVIILCLRLLQVTTKCLKHVITRTYMLNLVSLSGSISLYLCRFLSLCLSQSVFLYTLSIYVCPSICFCFLYVSVSLSLSLCLVSVCLSVFSDRLLHSVYASLSPVTPLSVSLSISACPGLCQSVWIFLSIYTVWKVSASLSRSVCLPVPFPPLPHGLFSFLFLCLTLFYLYDIFLRVGWSVIISVTASYIHVALIVT